MKTVRAGMLRHVVLMQRSMEVHNSVGYVTHVWSNMLETRAFVKPLTGGEWFISEHLLNTVDHQVIIRDPRSMKFTPKDRIIFGTRIFDIISIRNYEERQMHLNILVKERYDEVYILAAKNLLTEDGFELLTEAGENLVTEH